MGYTNDPRATGCRIVAELLRGPKTAQQLAASVGTTLATVYRWTIDLQEAGAVVVAGTIPQTGREGGSPRQLLALAGWPKGAQS